MLDGAGRYNLDVGSPAPAPKLRLVRPQASPVSATEEAPERRAREAPPALDDVELLASLRRGDTSAAAALYARARPQIDRTIMTLLRRSDPAHEDLVQLSMIALVGSFARFRGDCSLDTWTSRVTARTVLKELRRRRSESRLLDSALQLETITRKPDLERDVTDRDTMTRVQRHLDAMDPVKAWAVVLHDVCGYDLREIAEITGVSTAAAQSRLLRGRAELHARIGRDPDLRDALERIGGDR
jgi:RNA polymerase sigma-70 factor (ECF subfamily)